jgi:phospholipase B1, membrane-associated
MLQSAIVVFVVLCEGVIGQTPLRSTKSCPKLEARSSAPKNIHDLRVDDIKVISGIGDSITAGFGAKGLANSNRPIAISSLFENRGVAWSMGGDRGAATIANYFSTFSPGIVGASVGDHIANLCYGLICPPFQYKPEQDRFNAARSGSLVINLKDQVRWVRRQMRWNRDVNYQNDYKLMSMFIGSNDACIGCLPIIGKTVLSPDQFERNVREVLEEIRTIPRIVVSLYQQFNVSQVFDLTNPNPYCRKLRDVGLSLECACAFQDSKVGERTRDIMDRLVSEYNTRLIKIVADYERRNYNSFKVILDPLFAGVSLKTWTIDYISNVDCFHPSVKAHELMATGAWNNLVLPYEQKKRIVTPDVQVDCPSSASRIQ